MESGKITWSNFRPSRAEPRGEEEALRRIKPVPAPSHNHYLPCTIPWAKHYLYMMKKTYAQISEFSQLPLGDGHRPWTCLIVWAVQWCGNTWGLQKSSAGGDCLSLIGCGGVGQIKGMGKDFLDERNEGPENGKEHDVERSCLQFCIVGLSGINHYKSDFPFPVLEILYLEPK